MQSPDTTLKKHPLVPRLQELQEIIRYKFKRPELLFQSLTRPSAIKDCVVPECFSDYTCLEFLGDRILNAIVADAIGLHYPNLCVNARNRLYETLIKNTETENLHGGPIYRVAKNLGIENFIVMGPSDAYSTKQKRAQSHMKYKQRKKTQEAILSDHIEALIGAIYNDGGFDAAQRFVQHHWHFLGLNETKIELDSYGESVSGLPAVAEDKTQAKKLNNSLLLASMQGDWEQARIALQGGANVNIANEEGYRIIHYFSIFGNTEALQELIDEYHCDVNERTNDGWSSLLLAVSKKQVAAGQLLLDEGANVDFKVGGKTAMVLAAQHGLLNFLKAIIYIKVETNTNAWIKQMHEARRQTTDTEINNFLSKCIKKAIASKRKRRVRVQQEEKLRVGKVRIATEKMFTAISVNVESDTLSKLLPVISKLNADKPVFGQGIISRDKNTQKFTTILQQDKKFKEKFQHLYNFSCGISSRSALIVINFEKIKASINEGADIFARDENNLSLLHYFMFSYYASSKVMECLKLIFHAGTDFTGKDLGGIVLPHYLSISSDLELNGINFSRANLSGFDFSFIKKLSNINFTGANLTFANFYHVKLQQIDFTNADLTNTKIENVQGVMLGDLAHDQLGLQSLLTMMREEHIEQTDDQATEEVAIDRLSLQSLLIAIREGRANQRMLKLNLHKLDLRGLDLSPLTMSEFTYCERSNIFSLYHAKMDAYAFKSILPSLVKLCQKKPIHYLKGLDLRGADLGELDFNGLGLNGAMIDDICLGSLLPLARQNNVKLVGVRLFSRDYNREEHLCTNKSDWPLLDLSGWELAGIDLSHVDFGHCQLTKSDLTGTNLSHSVLSYVDLTDAHLTKTNFEKAKISQDTLLSINWPNANLSGARLTRKSHLSNDGKLAYVDLSERQLSYLCFKDYYLTTEIKYVSFSRANLQGCDFSNERLLFVNMEGANLSDACFHVQQLVNVEFNLAKFDRVKLNAYAFLYLATRHWKNRLQLTDIDVQGQIFTNKWLSRYFLGKYNEVNFAQIKLTRANFSGAKMTDTCFSKFLPFLGKEQMIVKKMKVIAPCLKGLDLRKRDFSGGMIFDKADFRGSDFTGTDFSQIVLNGMCNFKNANLINVNFSNAILESATFRDAILTDLKLDGATIHMAVFRSMYPELCKGQILLKDITLVATTKKAKGTIQLTTKKSNIIWGRLNIHSLTIKTHTMLAPNDQRELKELIKQDKVVIKMVDGDCKQVQSREVRCTKPFSFS